MVASRLAVERELYVAPPVPRGIAALEGDDFDVAVVGGGMHGAWVAWRAAAAGYRTALIERAEFGAATSANGLRILSSGLGGSRSLDVRHMYAAIHARREFARLAPDLIRPLQFIRPVGPGFMRFPGSRTALALNTLLSRRANAGVAAAAQLPRGGMIESSRCRQLLAPLAELAPASGLQWWSAFALDAARLTRAPLRAAVHAGAVLVSRAEVRSLKLRRGQVRGVLVRDGETGAEVEANARVVVDTTGPSAGRLAARAGLAGSAYMPRGWVGAVNLLLARNLGIECGIALPRAADATRPADMRHDVLFVPCDGVTMVGTGYRALTATTGGFAPESTAVSTQDVESLLDQVNQAAPRAQLRQEDVLRVHWSVLPSRARSAYAPYREPTVVAGQHAMGATGFVGVVADTIVSAPIVAERVLRHIKSMVAAARRLPDHRDYRRGRDR